MIAAAGRLRGWRRVPAGGLAAWQRWGAGSRWKRKGRCRKASGGPGAAKEAGRAARRRRARGATLHRAGRRLSLAARQHARRRRPRGPPQQQHCALPGLKVLPAPRACMHQGPRPCTFDRLGQNVPGGGRHQTTSAAFTHRPALDGCRSLNPPLLCARWAATPAVYKLGGDLCKTMTNRQAGEKACVWGVDIVNPGTEGRLGALKPARRQAVRAATRSEARVPSQRWLCARRVPPKKGWPGRRLGRAGGKEKRAPQNAGRKQN